MAAIHDLLAQVQDDALRIRLEQEINKLTKQKKFGLVFEEHLPECTPLYDMPVKRGSNVARKTGSVSDMYEVLAIKDGMAACVHKVTEEKKVIPVSDLVCVAQFGEPIYPYLKPLDCVCNAPDSDLWHTLIEADNYHALQLLEYLYAGKVDCIYIDPPYNTGAKDWKYNNDYVDGADTYRHSKWLSMMQKRLELAKKLLNPSDSVLIITIDEKEYLHLGCLLEEMFPDGVMQMVSITINPSGAKRDNLFSRSDEYAFIILFGNAQVIHPKGDGNEKEVRWWYLRRTDYSSRRGTVKGGIAQFYPIYVDNKTMKIVHVGEALTPEKSRFDVPKIKGATPVFPVREDGVEMNWGVTADTLLWLNSQGVVRVSPGNENQPYVFRYLSANYTEKVKSGRWKVKGFRKDGTKIVVEREGKITRATTVWQSKLYDAGQYGTSLLGSFIGSGKFSFPKSLYAVHDTLKFFVSSKKNALILDFFAGSGTTLHAVNLLNAEDDGNRRCILVTNNEVSIDEEIKLSNKGYSRGDEEWEKHGIAQSVTWKRTVNSILGINPNGEKIDEYYGADQEKFFPEKITVVEDGKQKMKNVYVKKKVPICSDISDIKVSDGFKANAVFFKLGFLDKTAVALGSQLAEMIPVLWLKAGAHGPCPELNNSKVDMMIRPENQFAILIDEKRFSDFEKEIKKYPEIQTIYFVTDSDSGYREMIKEYADKDTYQLYRDYLDNFRINTRR